jgi:hypothetical protein
MLTCKSPRKVMRVAWFLARGVLPDYFSKFSRHDFTLAQLFACLVVKEQQRETYRGIEALLRDAPHWCRDIGMNKVPDHNTLCRAFHALNLVRRAGRLLDRLTQWFAIARQLGSIVALDSSLYDPRYRSRHYEQRCRHYALSRKRSANARRSRTARQCPKLSVGVCTRSHLILSTRVRAPASDRTAATSSRCSSTRGDVTHACAACWPTPASTRRPTTGSRGTTWACGR